MRIPFVRNRFFARFATKLPLKSYLNKYFGANKQWVQTKDQVKLLTNLINIIRPIKKKETADLSELLMLLENNPEMASELSAFLSNLLKNRSFKTILVDAGIIEDTHFFKEVKRRIIAKLLPHQPKQDTLEYVLNQAFFSSNDANWINKLPADQLNRLIELLKFKSIFENIHVNSPFIQLFESIEILIRRVNGRVMETDVLKMVPEYDAHESPFVALEDEMSELRKLITKEKGYFLTPDIDSLKQFLVLHKQCQEFVDRAFRNSAKYGISLKVNQNLLRIDQQLERLKLLLNILTIQQEQDKERNTITLSKLLIEFNCYKNDISKLIDESTQLISYEITQHTAKTGEHYITTSKKEYMHMLKTAMGGGMIVGLMCITKVLLSKIDASDFGYAFLYSANYALGFIAIYLLGFTLATKQPAMTAAAFIQELKKGLQHGGNNKNKYADFAELFARLFRSQFIAFVGNVLVAFPVALIGIWIIDLIFDYNIAATKADKLLTDISPVHSLAILHAAIAGVFLFLSGIISGSIANRDKHLQIPYRIKEHPVLKLSLGKKRTKKLADFYEKKWAGIMSNMWFGVFMGSTASIGAFVGLNLDIRHITFAGGNFGLGLYGNDFSISGPMIFWVILGIGIIGLLNFLVSFVLSLLLAFRSRKIPLTEVRLVFSSNWQHFKKHPLSFFYPTRERDENKKEEA